MPVTRTSLALLLAGCLLGAAAPARADDGADEIPVVGRPADLPFSEASGVFRVSADAEPKALHVGQSVTFTLRVRAVGPVRQPPRRIDLRELPSFAGRFDFPEIGAGEDRRPDEQTWEFVYRLHPKNAGVTELPGVPFVFFNPEIQYPGKGFQTAYTDAVPLTVTEREVFPTPLVAPDFAFTAAPADHVVARQAPWSGPGPAATGALLLAPPLACFVWYLCWRRMYPDAVRRARQRRSLAARRALHRLHGADRLPPVERAARCAAVVAEYLRHRLDASMVEPTPAEAAACLERAGSSPALAGQTAGFLRDCDAVRFGPGGAADGRDLSADAVRVILAVEAETWSSQPS